MNTTIKKLYREARNAGYDAKQALHTARIVARWEELESQGFVKIELQHEEENYFSVYGEPDGYTNIYGKRVTADQERKAIADMIERDGCYASIGYYRTNIDDDDSWELADSVGMHVGYRDASDWRENWYIPDIMDDTMDKFENAYSDMLGGIC